MPRTYDGKDPAQHYVDSVILHGTPEALVEQVARLKEEIGLNYLMCAPLSRETLQAACRSGAAAAVNIASAMPSCRRR